MTDHDRSARASGRPRDTSIDERVLSVTRDLLVEVGWDGLSMRLVAARTGVGRSSLNRRWSSKAELVLQAILGETPDLAPFSGTDLTGWIDWVVRGSHELFARPDVRAAVPGLLLALGENDDLRRDLWARFSGPAVQLFADDVQATTPAKRRRADVDGRATLAMAAGAALFVTTVAVEDDSETLRNRIAQLLITAVAASHPQ
ncbi:TetR/AcrR family transcriptional regulator [Mycobacterium intracellulare]|uniref:TetR/AcrR family transcriptional regulator n=1 Tax=Mycobacterium intracellulare TaxID=1767 RepID=UPI0005B39869|nr:helix-turn-helix domain-containing protein [Mycobacterium intracellulare]AOS90268.1 TetR family transcriptional regulator [Mycobacterium intracellulare subsp. chimaera]ARV79945.1 TetR family transcriptional regulator [Mycobacterium intracellulare subsp. chimaera]ASL06853.1 TetR family transcriptional regulator [Mycobacterium intracellulare subsp. chimaera]ASL18550.1 TetR family transcriptional regulator [Mycobacterium intracellulare subsp. chimaera]KPN56102.1 TetR family transcriptional reg